MSKLSNFKIYFEKVPSDMLMAKIKKRTSTFRLSILNGQWKARIRYNKPGNERVEVAEYAETPTEAVKKLDRTMERMGLYERN